MATILLDGSGRLLTTDAGFLTTEFPVAPILDYNWSIAAKVIHPNSVRVHLDPTIDPLGYGRLYDHGSHNSLTVNRKINGLDVLNVIPVAGGESYDSRHDSILPAVADPPTAVDLMVVHSFDSIPQSAGFIGCSSTSGGDLKITSWNDAGTIKWAAFFATYEGVVADGSEHPTAAYIFRTNKPITTGAHVAGIRVSTPEEFSLRIDGEVLPFIDCHARLGNFSRAGAEAQGVFDPEWVFDGTDVVMSIVDGLAVLPDPVCPAAYVGGSGGNSPWWTGMADINAGPLPYSFPDAMPVVGFYGWEKRVTMFPILSDEQYALTVRMLLSPVSPVVTDITI